MTFADRDTLSEAILQCDSLLPEIVTRAARMGCEYADVRYLKTRFLDINLRHGVTTRIAGGEDCGLSIRVLFQGKWGFCAINNPSAIQIRAALDHAVQSAKASVQNRHSYITQQPPVTDAKFVATEISLSSLSIDERLAYLRTLEASVQACSARISQTTLGYSEGEGYQRVCNTFGTDTQQFLSRVRVWMKAAVQDDEGNLCIAESAVGRLGGFEVIQSLLRSGFARAIADNALHLADARERIPLQPYDVIVDPSVAGIIAHEVVGHNLEADWVIRGRSLFERLGTRIASDCVTLVDDATVDAANGSYFFDDEGIPAQRTTVVRDGILVEFLHSLETATLFGRHPNGKARAYLHQNPPIVRMSNTFFLPGQHRLQDLIASVDDGLFLQGGKWGHVDPRTGQFRCHVERGRRIRKGRLEAWLGPLEIYGNALECLQNIEACSQDLNLQLSNGMCNKEGQKMWIDAGGPYLKIRNLPVGSV